MTYIPFRVVALDSELPPPALADLLRGFVGDGPVAPFLGAVATDGFFIRRINEFRSTYMPVLHGSIAARRGGGSRVLLRLRPATIVLVFMTIWFCFLAAAAALILASERSRLLLLAPAGLATLSWHVMTSVFEADARWALEHLLERVPALRPGEGPGPPGGPDYRN